MEKHVEIAGKAYRMCYSVNALCEVEARAGGSLDGLMERQFTATRLLLWGGLMQLQPELTLRDAGDIIGAHLRQGGTLEEIVSLCSEALEEAGFFSGAAL
ncbi:MAG: hypothetical protein IJ466_12590 [Clostridia bacterium]|nr:hypothetical protein [Clostridia bacterium]